MFQTTKMVSGSPSTATGPSDAPNPAPCAGPSIEKVARASLAQAHGTIMEFPLGKPVEGSAKDMEFQEFVRRLSKSEQMNVRLQWFKTLNASTVASYLIEIAQRGEDILEAYRDPQFIELAHHPAFDAFVLYAMSSKMPEEKRLGVMDASALLCYSQALKTFGEVSVHDDSEYKERFAFFRKGLPADLPKQHSIFFSVPQDVYNQTRIREGKIDTSDLDHDLQRLAAYSKSEFFALDPALILPPAFLQGLADANGSGRVKIRPVLGKSQEEDFRDFSVRDASVPSSFEIPHTADSHTVPHTTAFYRHDAYHFLLDALNVNLDEYERLYKFFDQQAKINPSPAVKMFADFCLDREFVHRLIFNDRFWQISPDQMRAFEEICFFLDIATLVCASSPENVGELIPLLVQVIPKKFSLERAFQDPSFQREMKSHKSIELFLTLLKDSLS